MLCSLRLRNGAIDVDFGRHVLASQLPARIVCDVEDFDSHRVRGVRPRHSEKEVPRLAAADGPVRELVPFAVGAIFSAGAFYATNRLQQAQNKMDLKGIADMNRNLATREERRHLETVYTMMMQSETVGACQEIFRIMVLSKY